MMPLFRLERVVLPLVITFELAYQSCDRRFDWQIRDKVKVHKARGFSRGFAARVFGLRPKTCRPVADEAPRRTRENTSGTQGR